MNVNAMRMVGAGLVGVGAASYAASRLVDDDGTRGVLTKVGIGAAVGGLAAAGVSMLGGSGAGGAKMAALAGAGALVLAGCSFPYNGPPALADAESVKSIEPALDKDVSTKPLGTFGGLTRVPSSLSHTNFSSTATVEGTSRTISLGGGGGIATDLRSAVFGDLANANVGAGVMGGAGWTKSKMTISESGSATTTSWAYTERPQRLRFDRDVTSRSADPDGFKTLDEAIIGTRHMHGTNPYDRASSDPAAMTNEVALAYRRSDDGTIRVFEIDAEQELSVIVDTMAITDPSVEAIVIDGSLYRPSETVVNEVGDEARLFEYEARASNVAELKGGSLPTTMQAAGASLARGLREGDDSYGTAFSFTPGAKDWSQAVEYSSYEDAIKGLHGDDYVRQGAIVSVEAEGRTAYFAGTIDTWEGKDVTALFSDEVRSLGSETDSGSMKLEALFQGSGSDWQVRRLD